MIRCTCQLQVLGANRFCGQLRINGPGTLKPECVCTADSWASRGHTCHSPPGRVPSFLFRIVSWNDRNNEEQGISVAVCNILQQHQHRLYSLKYLQYINSPWKPGDAPGCPLATAAPPRVNPWERGFSWRYDRETIFLISQFRHQFHYAPIKTEKQERRGQPVTIHNKCNLLFIICRLYIFR